ncbi:hypothetical protein [Gemmobacter sp. 24YEA27]|uniref:hypothetical protein n=1 Tax=Gemmobacter sp. 24YEA27 TaxID=3040672 RepID=UPI0024B3AF4C|nr:hypothetical protein [Gemmobacter sp. 24YEA27]
MGDPARISALFLEGKDEADFSCAIAGLPLTATILSLGKRSAKKGICQFGLAEPDVWIRAMVMIALPPDPGATGRIGNGLIGWLRSRRVDTENRKIWRKSHHEQPFPTPAQIM